MADTATAIASRAALLRARQQAAEAAPRPEGCTVHLLGTLARHAELRMDRDQQHVHVCVVLEQAGALPSVAARRTLDAEGCGYAIAKGIAARLRAGTRCAVRGAGLRMRTREGERVLELERVDELHSLEPLPACPHP